MNDSAANFVVPPVNTAVFKLLFVVEVGLREMIIREFERRGPSEWKRRLPPDVLERFREARMYESAVSWISLVPHHPIYYLDFPDLRKIIESGGNWPDVFRPIFKRKDVVGVTLAEIEPIRNRLAHNRLLSEKDLNVVEGAYTKLTNAIGVDALSEWAAKPTIDFAIEDTFGKLRSEAEQSLSTCQQFEALELVVWPEVRKRWWFDEDYLQHPIDNVEAYFDVLETYRLLPRVRGSGHEIERWVKSSNLEMVAERAIAQIDVLRDGRGRG